MSNTPSANVDHSHDGVFFTAFSLVMGFIIGLTLIIVLIANVIAPSDDGDPAMLRAQISERIAPVGQVYTDASEVAMAAQAPAAPAAASERTGAEVVSANCASCHMAGVLNAPKLDATDVWQARLDAAGLDMLVSNAINGIRGMPPRGGAPLDDDEVRRAVVAMLEGAGVSAE